MSILRYLIGPSLLIVVSIIAFIVSSYIYDIIIPNINVESTIIMKIIFLLTLAIVIQIFSKLITMMNSELVQGDMLSLVGNISGVVLLISLFFTFDMTTLKTVWIGSSVVVTILLSILSGLGNIFGYRGV